jgi:hypothetical protein
MCGRYTHLVTWSELVYEPHAPRLRRRQAPLVHRDAIGARLTTGDTASTLRHAEQLEAYTPPEPLPCSDLVITHARALARLRHPCGDEAARSDLASVRDALVAAGLVAFLAPVEATLAT